MSFNSCAGIGIVLAVVVSILAGQQVSKDWDEKEPFSYNAKLSVMKLLVAKPLEIMDKPLEVQIEYWAKATRFMEEGSRE